MNHDRLLDRYERLRQEHFDPADPRGSLLAIARVLLGAFPTARVAGGSRPGARTAAGAIGGAERATGSALLRLRRRQGVAAALQVELPKDG
jgi:hypothetical protein